jgi:peroxiredoxin
VGDPRVGQDAPDFSLPYITAVGPGPADQPFRLRSELGRRVVLVFSGPPEGEVTRRLWEFLAAGDDSLFAPATVVVGVFRAPPAPVQALATAIASRFKLLPDSAGQAFRRFGVGRGPSPAGSATVFVVGDDGRVVHRSRAFRPDDPGEVERLRAAVRGS